MLTYEDCIGLSDLTEDEIKAIAEHENLPEIVALEFGHYLIEAENGVPAIKAIIVDDIAQANADGNHKHAAKLKLILRHFVNTHPENPNPT